MGLIQLIFSPLGKILIAIITILGIAVSIFAGGVKHEKNAASQRAYKSLKKKVRTKNEVKNRIDSRSDDAVIERLRNNWTRGE